MPGRGDRGFAVCRKEGRLRVDRSSTVPAGALRGHAGDDGVTGPSGIRPRLTMAGRKVLLAFQSRTGLGPPECSLLVAEVVSTGAEHSYGGHDARSVLLDSCQHRQMQGPATISLQQLHPTNPSDRLTVDKPVKADPSSDSERPGLAGRMSWLRATAAPQQHRTSSRRGASEVRPLAHFPHVGRRSRDHIASWSCRAALPMSILSQRGRQTVDLRLATTLAGERNIGMMLVPVTVPRP
jgi:hypothetical protein